MDMATGNKSNTRYYLKLIAVILIWAGLYHVAKPATEVSDPYLIAFLRFILSAILLLLLLKQKTGVFIPSLTRRQWFSLIMVGALGGCAYSILFFNAEALISANIVAILYAFTPCLTILISSYVFKTKLQLMSKIGIVIGLIGAIGVVNYATPSCQQFFCADIFSNINRGELFGIAATIAFSCYSVVNKYTSQQGVPTITINAYTAVFGCIFLGIFAVFKANFAVIPGLPLSFWAALFYISVLATIVSYAWYTDAIIHLGISKTVIFQNTLPLITIILGYIFFGTKIGFGELICGSIIITGVYLTNCTIKHE